MTRTTNIKRIDLASECKKVTDKYPDYFTFDAEDWFSKLSNFGYKEDENVAFAEFKSPGNYWVHFCYHTARGREAIELTKRMLDQLYKDTGFNSVVGLIEKQNRKARWLIRQVGFISLGDTETENGLCEMFVLIKKKD